MLGRRATGYDLVWHEGSAGTMRWQRHDDAGQLLTGATIANNDPSYMEIAPAAGDTALTWTDDRSGTSDIYALRIGEQGPMPEAPFTSNVPNSSNSMIACGHGVCAVAFVDFRSGFPETFVSTWTGTAVDEHLVLTNCSDARIVTTTTSFAVTCVRSGAPSELYVSVLDASGVPQPAQYVGPHSGSAGFPIPLAARGDEIAYGYIDTNDLLVFRVATDGTSLGPSLRYPSNAMVSIQGFQIAAISTGYALSWREAPVNRVLLVDEELTPMGSSVILDDAANTPARVITDGGGVTALWSGLHDANRDIYMSTLCP